MKKMFTMLDNLMMAVTFAEAGVDFRDFTKQQKRTEGRSPKKVRHHRSGKSARFRQPIHTVNSQPGFMKSMSNLFKIFEDSMVAATFAEAGEHETARRYLGKNKTAHKKILLVTSALDITPRTLRQAISICKRIGAMLEVLHILPASGSQADQRNGPAKNSMANLLRIKKRFKGFGIFYEFALGFSSLEDEIIRYAAGRRDIMLLILDIADKAIGRGCAKEPDSHLLEQFKCPVVLLAESHPA
ncbi:MAG TPA: universal stress protein [Desulfatiglandales bacterium]|nr:universal stress protein [Desulfatiglandales bacterium]